MHSALTSHWCFNCELIKMEENKLKLDNFKTKLQKYFHYLRNFEVPPKAFYFSSDSISIAELFDELLNYISIPLRFFGFGIYDDNYIYCSKIFIMWTLAALIITLIVFCNLYTFRDETVKFLYSFLCLSFIPQVAARFYTFIALRENHLELKELSKNFIESYEDKKSKEIFEGWILKATHLIFTYVFLHCIVVSVLLLFPILYLIILNERVLLIGIELPFMDWKNSFFAFSLHVIFHGFLSCVYVTSTLATVGVVITFLTVSFAQFDTLKMHLATLNDLAIKENHDSLKIKELIRKIAISHNNVLE